MKTQPRESVSQDWVCDLTFTQQAVLALATRGPDGLLKDTSGKRLLHYLRGTVIKPAHPTFQFNDGFMSTDYGKIEWHTDHWNNPTDEVAKQFGWKFEEVGTRFLQDVDSYPLHFFMHVVHAAEVIGYKYPGNDIRALWYALYKSMCDGFHMNPETEEQLDKRLKY